MSQTAKPGPARLLPALRRAMQHPGGASATARPRVAASCHNHCDHDHDIAPGNGPSLLPHWLHKHWTLVLLFAAGMFFLAGWVGQRFLGFSPEVALLFYALAYLAGGYEIATHAIPGLFRGVLNTDILMLAAALGAATLGEWQDGALLLILFGLGHAGEHYALDRARHAVRALGTLMPQTARVRRGNLMVETAVEQLQPGDLVVVRPGDRVPVDGAVVNGSSTIDQSPITGESMPVPKGPQDQVFAGTINHEGALEVRVTRLAADTTLSRVIQLVAEAQRRTSPTQQRTDRFTTYFVPVVLVVVLLVVIVPPLVGWLSFEQSFYRAMLLLVAASPCALALGAPAAVLAGIAQAARNGVLIKGGAHLESLGSLGAIAFDKTGTLTQGRFSVTDVIGLGGTSPDALLSLAAAVEQQSNHPLALAVVRAAGERRLDLPEATAVRNIPGAGVQSLVEGHEVLIGAPRLFQEQGITIDDQLAGMLRRLEINGHSTMLVHWGGRFLGILGLADSPRSGAPEALQRLESMGVKHLVMLTGDSASAAHAIARTTGVTEVRAELLPEDKLLAIQSLQTQYGAVGMLGDGVNDAPALAVATVGIAMGGAGTAVALETADVALIGDDLRKLPFAVGLSRASRSIIRQNLAVALGTIVLLILSSVLGLVPLSWAVVLHEGSTLVVVFNALRLLAYR